MDSSKVSKVLEKVSGKWKVSILESLESKNLRFTDLRGSLEGVSNKVLSEALKDLEENELIEKKDSGAYKLTSKGFELLRVLENFEDWFDSYEDTSKEVIIIEDDDNQANLYKKWLEDFNVTICEHDTVFSCVSDKTSVVIMDRDHPGVETEIFLSRVREAKIPVVMVSGVEPGPDIVDLDIQDYLLKPVDREDIVNSVNQITDWDDLSREKRDLHVLKAKMDVLKKKYSQEELESDENFEEFVKRFKNLEQ